MYNAAFLQKCIAFQECWEIPRMETANNYGGLLADQRCKMIFFAQEPNHKELAEVTGIQGK